MKVKYFFRLTKLREFIAIRFALNHNIKCKLRIAQSNKDHKKMVNMKYIYNTYFYIPKQKMV